MILSDHAIRERLDELVDDAGRIDNDQIQPASLDIKLGMELFDQHRAVNVEPEDITGSGLFHDLVPNKPYLGHTVEYVTLPNDVAAMMTGRSSLARRNVVVHQTAGWVDPGFEGQLTFEILNFGHDVETVRVGERVAQLVFFELDRPSTGYQGKYQGQTGVRGASDD